jgi:hypothetical protein
MTFTAPADPVHQPFGVFFGTHNWTSCEFFPEELVKKGLGVVERVGIDKVQEIVVRIPPEVGERVAFGQLYGTLNSSAHSRSPSIDSKYPSHYSKP